MNLINLRGGMATTVFVAAIGSGYALPDVLICAAASTSITAGQFTDPQAKLQATGRFGNVDIFNASSGTPTLSQLQAYDAVIVWSNVNFSSASALGDVLADYVDAGGGVVLAVFANSTTTVNRYLTGRWQIGNYNVIPPALGTTSGSSSLGSTLDPGHPLMEGVNSLSATTASRPTSLALNSGCKVVSTWADGKFLTATHPLQNRCDIGLYPPSNAVSAGFWNQATDGASVLANALRWAASVRVNPSSINVMAGTQFGGSVASLAQSDNDKLSIINDEFDSNTEVEFEAMVPTGTYGTILYMIAEVAATRTDLLVFVDHFHHDSQSWINWGSGLATLSDKRMWVKVNSSGNISGLGTVKSRIRFTPTADLDAADGWSESIDEFGWVINRD